MARCSGPVGPRNCASGAVGGAPEHDPAGPELDLVGNLEFAGAQESGTAKSLPIWRHGRQRVHGLLDSLCVVARAGG